MRISARGWNRDMGTKEIAKFSLSEIRPSDQPTRPVGHDRPGIFTAPGRLFIAWFQTLSHMGNYRMEMELSADEVLALFKAKFGAELREWLVDREGFTISPELTKRALRTIKLTDVTLADLAAMSVAPAEEPATAEKLVEGSATTSRH
jgi:hypothetical protein